MQKTVSIPFAFGELHITLVATGPAFDNDENGSAYFDNALDLAMNGAIHLGKPVFSGLCKQFDNAQELQTEPLVTTLSLLDHSIVIDTSVTTTKRVDENVINAILVKTAIPETIGYASDVITAYHAKTTFDASESIKELQQKARERVMNHPVLGGFFGDGVRLTAISLNDFGFGPTHTGASDEPVLH
jgi:hypothetical protein